jgi:hypothetical protein
MTIKRYAVTLQREVIIYAINKEAAKITAIRNHSDLTYIKIRRLKAIEEERSFLIDNRKAPGS